MSAYRWNQIELAAGYDASAEHVHPHYRQMQDVILRLLAPLVETAGKGGGGLIVDLGGGTGRLAERLLERFATVRVLVVDQSEAALQLAGGRLERFGDRGRVACHKLQGDWAAELDEPPRAIVSMSAIHHLEPAQKLALYGRCHAALAAGGVLLNGDEVRAEDDAEYLSQVSAWAEHMRRVMADGLVAESFHDALYGWIDRNVRRFGEARTSGDDCHETIEAQLGYFRQAGFATADVPWQQDMWAMLRGAK